MTQVLSRKFDELRSFRIVQKFIHEQYVFLIYATMVDQMEFLFQFNLF